MKKAATLLLILVMCLALCSCKSKEIQCVENLIEAIGEVTRESENAIISAENAYNILSDEDKAKVKNYEVLIQSRSTFDSLIDALMNEKYDHGLSLLDKGDYQSAYTVFEELGEYKDSIEKLEEASNGIQYLEALNLIEHGAYWEAHAIFLSIADFRDVPNYLARYKTTDITPDNWDTYFEICEIPLYMDNAFGEVAEIYLAYCLNLKDEYSLKLCADDTLCVIFEVTYESVGVTMDVDTVAHTYSYTDEYPDCKSSPVTRTAVFDRDALTSEAIFSDYDSLNALARKNAFITHAIQPMTIDGVLGWHSGALFKSLDITRATGSITFFV